MRRSLWVIILLLVLVGFAGIQQYSSWSLSKPQEKSAGNPEGSVDAGSSGGQGRSAGQARGAGSRDAIPVLVAIAAQKSVPVQIRAVGNVEAFSTVSIKSQVTGVLMKAHFKEGQNVKQGQLLFTIDPRPLEATLKQAEATLARDSAQLQNAREQARRYADLVKKQCRLERAGIDGEEKLSLFDILTFFEVGFHKHARDLTFDGHGGKGFDVTDGANLNRD